MCNRDNWLCHLTENNFLCGRLFRVLILYSVYLIIVSSFLFLCYLYSVLPRSVLFDLCINTYLMLFTIP
jgi:hypothetical protein